MDLSVVTQSIGELISRRQTRVALSVEVLSAMFVAPFAPDNCKALKEPPADIWSLRVSRQSSTCRPLIRCNAVKA